MNNDDDYILVETCQMSANRERYVQQVGYIYIYIYKRYSTKQKIEKVTSRTGVYIQKNINRKKILEMTSIHSTATHW